MSMFKRFKETQCDKMQKLLTAYIDGQLSLPEQEMVEQHLKVCQNCQAELDSLRETVNLLHRMPMASPRCSFVISKAKLAPRRSVFGALRIATVVAALCLATIFCGDVMHVFDTPPPPSPGPWEPSQWERYTWPVRETEYGLLGVTVTLAGVTIALWQRTKKGRSSVAKPK